MDGLLVVDKPAGPTSHDVVAKLLGIYGQRRVGHAGTLDPDATGVLLVGLGRCTRLLRFLQETSKAYRGVVAFGVATSTLDAAVTATFREAVLAGIAPSGGLWMPEPLPHFEDWPELLPRYRELYQNRAYLPAEETKPVRSQVSALAGELGVADRRVHPAEPEPEPEQLALAV